MVRSAAVGHQGGREDDAPSQSAAAALAKLSASVKPQPVVRLPAVLSVRILLLVLVVVLSVGFLIPVISHSRDGGGQITTTHGIVGMPRSGRSHHDRIKWRSYTLREAVEAVAKDGQVIVCTVSHPYSEFLNNWLISLAKQNRHQSALIIAEDYATLEFVNHRWPGHAVLVPPAPLLTPSLNFGSQGFFNLTSRRPQYLLEILELGYSVLYNDVDMVWLADPFPYFKGDHDVYFTDDIKLIKSDAHSHALPAPGKKGRTYICSCMLFLRPTKGAKLLMQTWMKELKDQPWSPQLKANDQPGLNWALNKTAGQVDVYLLPQVAFPSGGLYFKNETWRKATGGKHVLVHNNYVIGFDKKIQRFLDFGLWFVDVDAGLSPLSEKGG